MHSFTCFYTSSFYVYFCQIEIERVQYALARYLRTRMLKIENQLGKIVTDTNDTTLYDKLSEEEQIFASNLDGLNKRHRQTNVADKIDLHKANQDRMDGSVKNFRCNSEFVFCKAEKEVQNIESLNDITMKPGDVCILRYSSIAENLKNQEVHLF